MQFTEVTCVTLRMRGKYQIYAPVYTREKVTITFNLAGSTLTYQLWMYALS